MEYRAAGIETSNQPPLFEAQPTNRGRTACLYPPLFQRTADLPFGQLCASNCGPGDRNSAHLDGDFAAEAGVPGAIHFAHPARAKRSEDFVGAEPRSGGKLRSAGGYHTAPVGAVLSEPAAQLTVPPPLFRAAADLPFGHQGPRSSCRPPQFGSWRLARQLISTDALLPAMTHVCPAVTTAESPDSCR
jgi:hypothetical protein